MRSMPRTETECLSISASTQLAKKCIFLKACVGSKGWMRGWMGGGEKRAWETAGATAVEPAGREDEAGVRFQS